MDPHQVVLEDEGQALLVQEGKEGEGVQDQPVVKESERDMDNLRKWWKKRKSVERKSFF